MDKFISSGLISVLFYSMTQKRTLNTKEIIAIFVITGLTNGMIIPKILSSE